MDESMLDGNAAAGDLQELFAVEVTQMVGVCDGCGTSGPLAEARMFVHAPGLTLRCPGATPCWRGSCTCPDRTLVELQGFRRLELLSCVEARERRAQLVRDRARATVGAVDEDVHEPALGGRLRVVLAEQPDLVAHARAAEVRDPQPGATVSGRSPPP